MGNHLSRAPPSVPGEWADVLKPHEHDGRRDVPQATFTLHKGFNPRTVELLDGYGLCVLARGWARAGATPCAVGAPAMRSDSSACGGQITECSVAGHEARVVWELDVRQDLSVLHAARRDLTSSSASVQSPVFTCLPEVVEGDRCTNSAVKAKSGKPPRNPARATTAADHAPSAGNAAAGEQVGSMSADLDLQGLKLGQGDSASGRSAVRENGHAPDSNGKGAWAGLSTWRLMWVISEPPGSACASLFLCHQAPTLHTAHPPEASMHAVDDPRSTSSGSNGSCNPTTTDTRSAPAAPAGDDTACARPAPAALPPLLTGSTHTSPLVAWHVMVQGLAGGAVRTLSTGAVPLHDYSPTQQHTRWGVHGLLSAGDLDALLACDQLRVCVQLVWEPRTLNQAALLARQPHAAAPAGACLLGPEPQPTADRVLLASLSPRILVVDGFMSREMCEGLIRLAEPRLVRSRVSTGTETPSRTSWGTFLTGAATQLPQVLEAEARIATLMSSPAVIGGKPPLVPTEALQIVRYWPGEFYTSHYDNRAGGQVSRHATILVYLADCEAGGGTHFERATAPPTEEEVPVGSSLSHVALLTQELHAQPRVPRPGVRVMPVQGRALVFWSGLPDGTEDLASLHAAEAVQAGTKWIASRWFKEASS